MTSIDDLIKEELKDTFNNKGDFPDFLQTKPELVEFWLQLDNQLPCPQSFAQDAAEESMLE